MRLIDADALLSEFEWLKSVVNESSKDEIQEIIQRIENAPTVEAVVFPCKIGDTVFEFDRLADPDLCSKCPHFCWGGMGDSHECGKTEDGFRSAECISISEWTASMNLILGWIRFNEFNRTVFLTREEAEAALAERMKKDAEQ